MKKDKRPKPRPDIVVCFNCRTQYKVLDADASVKQNDECLKCHGTLVTEARLMEIVGSPNIEKPGLKPKWEDPLPGQMDIFKAREELMRNAERKIKRSGFEKEEKDGKEG